MQGRKHASEASITFAAPRSKVYAFTRRQRQKKRLAREKVLREERKAERAERREFARKYGVFFGCDPLRTLILAGGGIPGPYRETEFLLDQEG